MWQSARDSSSFTDLRSLLAMTVRAIAASWRAKFREHLVVLGAGGYILIWVGLPLFQLAVAGLIYRGVKPELVAYAVVGIAMSTFITNALYYIGQVLDEERQVGTLPGLFLAPCPRLSWLTGFALGGLAETGLAAGVTLLFGISVFGVRLDPSYPALALTFVLFLISLWGMGFVFSALGLVLKRSNDLANLLWPLLTLLGGIYYPIALLPIWLRVPAHALPIGYGIDALSKAALHHARLVDVSSDLLALTAFAAVLPFIGIGAFLWLERRVRRLGALDLY